MFRAGCLGPKCGRVFRAGCLGPIRSRVFRARCLGPRRGRVFRAGCLGHKHGRVFRAGCLGHNHSYSYFQLVNLKTSEYIQQISKCRRSPTLANIVSCQNWKICHNL